MTTTSYAVIGTGPSRLAVMRALGTAGIVATGRTGSIAGDASLRAVPTAEAGAG
ncbi:hypothetical protein [Microbacterium capsulatum]|uniref:Uncharacterized protein n=1 Tax=Microbacterium capsulatum TaxID=3041921 RepID=A0ABU0XHA8_9MICO|nr:hypothetical protein [Microbacterium sp. ASV81]MDQ4214514.1 hypothetical protein [Microbacterium sp. ASV81]